MPIRVQQKRTKGWRMPPNTVSVARPGPFGNPFRIGANRCTGSGLTYRQEPVADAATAVAFFKGMLQQADRNYPSNEVIARELRGKNLACFCALDQPCHADVLLEIANVDAPE